MLTMILGHMLTKETDYIWVRPALLARKFRATELKAGLPPSIQSGAVHMTTTPRKEGSRTQTC